MTSIVSIQNGLNAGELTPSLFGRTDLEKYALGCSTSRNFFASYKGGASSRAGLAYVGMCKQQYPVPPRDIPFQFSIDQGYVLEFGQNYMRVKSDGAYVVEASKNVVSVNILGVFSVAAHGYSVGDWVYDLDNVGFSGLTWIINSVSTDSFTVTDLFGNPVTSATASTGGTVARVYTVVSPYAAVDLPYLKYTQSADVMTLCCVNQVTKTEYPPYDLTRVSNTNWVFTQETFTSSISAPTNVVATGFSSSTVNTQYAYVVTAIDRNTGEESVASTPAVVQNVDISTVLGSNTIIWNAVGSASSYNVYAATPSYGSTVPVSSLFGFIGTALGPSFVDTNITPDFTKVPPQHTDPFARGIVEGVNITNVGNGKYDQATVGYTITTSTGSGFAGSPVVSEPYIFGTGQAGGTILGFLPTNHGKNYLGTDTIAFTDSGGGHAQAGITFAANPADGDSYYFNSIKVIFKLQPVPSPTAGNIFCPVEQTKELTVQSLSNVLNASLLLSLSVASYSYSGNNLLIIYKTPGTIGNSYAFGPVLPMANVLAGGGTAGASATGTLIVGPETGTYPSVAAYFQDRRVYANSLNQPDTYWMSQPGLFSNMDSSIPVTSGDAITGTPWAQQINGIQFLVPMPGGLVVLTGKGAWQVNGGQSSAITPSNQTATAQAYNGCNSIVPPFTINYDILYVQSKGSIWRDLSYNFYTNIYTGTDITVLSSHLFTDFQSVQATWAEEPFKILWVVRNDGKLLALTYLKEQNVNAWTRHDTNGLFVGVCSVTELPVDAVYVITQRYIQGAWRYYSERMDNRIWDTVEDAFCVDAGLAYKGTPGNAILDVPSATGTNILFSASSAVFNSGMVGNVIRAGGGKATITSYVDTSHIRCTINNAITEITPDTTNPRPVPFASGSWTISVPVTVLSGLNHLEGMTVAILADGSVIPNQVVANGSITLDYPASQIVVGLPYVCQLQTMYMDTPPIQGQSVQNKRKNISAVGVRVEASRGLQVGADQVDASTQPNFNEVPWVNMNEIKERTMAVNAGDAVPLFTGDYYKAITSGWAPEGQIAVQQVYPLPANVLALVAYWNLGDDK